MHCSFNIFILIAGLIVLLSSSAAYSQQVYFDSQEVEIKYREATKALSEGKYLNFILTTHPYLLKGVDIEEAVNQAVHNSPRPGQLLLEIDSILLGPIIQNDTSVFQIFKVATTTVVHIVPEGRSRNEISVSAFERQKHSYIEGLTESEYSYDDSLAVLYLKDEQFVIASKYQESTNIYFTEYTASDDTNLYWIFGQDYIPIVTSAEPFKREHLVRWY